MEIIPITLSANGVIILRTGMKKKDKVTEIYFNEADSIMYGRTYNTKLKKQLRQLAVDYPEQCKIIEERYLAMNGQYEAEYNELKAQAQALHERITATETATMNAQIFSDLIEKYADLQELNARILNELIDRIVIHEKEIINGEKYQTVEIYYKFVGVV